MRETREEIRERLRAPERRHRSYPRVVKRKHVGAKLLKRPHHVTIRHAGPPHLHIFTNTA